MRFDGYLICTDCDGTLTDTKGQLSNENADAIRYFQEEGGRFTLATGRLANHLQQFAPKMQINAPMISLNGTLIYDTRQNRVLKEWKLSKQLASPVIAYVVSHWPQVKEIWLNCSLGDGIAFCPGRMNWYSCAASLPEEWYKLVMIQEADVTRLLKQDLQEKFGQLFRFDSSWPEGLEMQRVDSGKGMAVQWLKAYYQGAVHTTVCIGDAENDISMLACGDISYAVDNAMEEVKQAANRQTVCNNAHAIAHVIQDLEEQVR